MQRTSKFRAWDKINGRWLDLFQLAFARDGSVMAVNTLDGEIYGLHQVEILEYTGLKDSQVIEQYFGDIVICQSEEDTWSVYVVEDGKSAVLYKDVDTGDIKYFWQLGVSYVIGNIYENPLEATNEM